MFYSGKKKPLAQVFRETNSGNRFVKELAKHEERLVNKSFDTAQNLMAKKTNLRQTQICIRRSLKRPSESPNCSFTTAEQLETKTELFLMPMPKAKAVRENTNLNKTFCAAQPASKESVDNKLEAETTSYGDPMKEPQRNMKVLVGNVGFVVQMTKTYPKLNSLWDVYGKLIKISKGKHRYEQHMLIRNMDGSGPILQCSYFDFNKRLESIAIGSNVRLVGNIVGSNCLRTFRIDPLTRPPTQSHFMRIQNVNSFILLQEKSTSD